VKAEALAAVTLLGAALFAAAHDLPAVGDPGSPAATHVSPRYLEKSVEETATPNVVTSVLADYRGFDTLGETTVIFTAGVACWLILSGLRRKEEGDREGGP
jgi:multicomponent Na+:H+ antiporter subunit B